MAARNRRHMNEAAALERAHWPAEHLRAEEVAGQVDRENRVPFGERQIVEPAGPQYGRGVDENVAVPAIFRPPRPGGTPALEVSQRAMKGSAPVSRNPAAVTSRPRSSRSMAATRAPARARPAATARPMPPPPPVTTHTRPDRPSQSDGFCPVMMTLVLWWRGDDSRHSRKPVWIDRIYAMAAAGCAGRYAQ
jgi:hypothetical protein